MITDVVQRWRGGRSSYRPAGEPVAARDLDVGASRDHQGMKAFVVSHHYAARAGSIVRGFELREVLLTNDELSQVVSSLIPDSY